MEALPPVQPNSLPPFLQKAKVLYQVMQTTNRSSCGNERDQEIEKQPAEGSSGTGTVLQAGGPKFKPSASKKKKKWKMSKQKSKLFEKNEVGKS